jgi:ATP-dependent Lhr-like helicase
MFAMVKDDVLDLFHPAVRRWFAESFAAPTPPQSLGWPPIARGENTLILAPTGSGKTLAAFLFAINDLVVRCERGDEARGVQILYLSPLKALAADIERNLTAPLAGIRRGADGRGIDLPEVTVGVRTGDTSTSERQRMLRHPPQILITTPESLHLLLTSKRSREILQTIRYAIVDEIHAVCASKRGTFLSLLLERLQALVGQPFVRIGLSATQRPLEEVARFLGGYEAAGLPRSVTIVDAGYRKDLDLAVISPVEDMTDLPCEEDGAPSIWPAIYEQLLTLINSHRSTLIFANDRRSVERIAAELNKRAGYTLVQAHHGSVSKEQRSEIEQDLKAGRLPALVATGSLELGIDMGAIDLVCQVESPHSVARGLQRVGRAGHLYRASSVGRLIPKTREDLLEMAALARAMRHREISAVHIPACPLDVLAQQVVAMVAVEEREVDPLYDLIRKAAPYHALTKDAFLSVLDMLSGGYQTPASSNLRPRISWDRVNDRLYPLPGSRHLAILNGGAIPDTGQYPVVLEEGGTRLGELDEEFIYERRVGETILLGTGRWRITKIGADRVHVVPSEERAAQIPFWRGEGLGRDAEFGRRFGAFLRECESRLTDSGFTDWLQEECSLDGAAARNLQWYLTDQFERGGTIPNDRVILLDAFQDELGEARLALLSPFGRSFHHAFLLAALAAFRRQGKAIPLAVHSDAGILFKLGDISVERAVSILRSIRPGEVEDLITDEVEGSTLFGMRFRQNAARALLLPRLRPGKRTPLWLQRLRARDLLALARSYRSFPIVAETYREVMDDRLPLRELRKFLSAVEVGKARFAVRRGKRPSPFSSSLLFDFTAQYLYEWDEPKPLPAGSRVDRGAVSALLGKDVSSHLLDQAAIAAMEERLQGRGEFERARDGTELVELLRRIGDLTREELSARTAPEALAALPDLLDDGRVAQVELPDLVAEPSRFVAGEDRSCYARLNEEDLRFIVGRYLATHALLTRKEILARYPIPEEVLDRLLDEMDLVRVMMPDGSHCFGDPQVVEGIRRLTISQKRRAVKAVSPHVFSDFLLHFQHLYEPVVGIEGVREVLVDLSWLSLPVSIWPCVLGARVQGYHKDLLEGLLRSGEFIWRGETVGKGTFRIAFTPRTELPIFQRFFRPEEVEQDAFQARVIEFLRDRGASFLSEIATHLDESPSRVARSLWTLIWTGRVTNDSLAPVWAGKPREELWRPGRRRRGGWTGGAGRWTILPSIEEEPTGKDMETLIARLLSRYGVLCRETLALAGSPVRWGTLYRILSRLEWGGKVERGFFVERLSGVQFALQGTVERLSSPHKSGKSVLLSSLDPANPYGASSLFPLSDGNNEGFTLRRHPGNFLVLRSGVPILAIENHGERLTPLVTLDKEGRRDALALLSEIVRFEQRTRAIRVRMWNKEPVTSSVVVKDLEALGFIREDLEMIYYRGYAH